MKSGTKLGPYEILAPLGAGGMGEVYRARDTRLGREVAVKVLPAGFAADPERMRRFEQEARTVAALNHPNILALHDIGTHDGGPYIVTELLEGSTLREQMPVPRRKALDYAQQVCQGLAAAHAKGVTHRDLKPENLFVTSDGRVKILDFGLAKVASEQIELTATAATTPGLAMGTAGYMSPEQARGKSADARSDIFSLGVVCYEMLAGERAFQRDSAVETMNAILKEDPPPLADAALERIVRRCLEKSPEQRFQSASDLGFAIGALSGPSAAVAGVIAPSVSRRSFLWPALVVLALAAGVAGGFWWQARREAATPGWTGVRLGGPSIAYVPRLSPDGRTLAFLTVVDGQSQLAVMNPVSSDWTVLTRDRSTGWLNSYCWSRDGTKLYFDRWFGSPNGIYSVPALGGEARLILEAAGNPETLPDGSLIVVLTNRDRRLQLHRFWPETGKLQPLPAFTSDAAFYSTLRAFPDGRTLIFQGRPAAEGQPEPAYGLYYLDLDSGKTRGFLEVKTFEGQALAVTSDGSILTDVPAGDLHRVAKLDRNGPGRPQSLLTLTNQFWGLDMASDGSLYADQIEGAYEFLRFPVSGGVAEKVADAAVGTWRGSLTQLPDRRFLIQASPAGRPRLLVVGTGASKDPLPFVQSEETTSEMVTVLGDRHAAFLAGGAGSPTEVAIVALDNGRIVRRLSRTRGLPIVGLASSPDGKTVYYAASGSIWAIPAEDGEPRKVTAGEGVAAHPRGAEIVVQRNEPSGARLFRIQLQGGAEQEVPFPGPLRKHAQPITPNAVRDDGRIVVLANSADSYWNQIVILDPKTGKAERVAVQHSGDIFAPGWAPDGKILATGAPLKAALWRFTRK